MKINTDRSLVLAGIVISVILAFLTYKANNTSPLLEYDVVSKTNYINDKKPISNVVIEVNGVDILDKHFNLSTFDIRVENKGTKNIGQGDYQNDNDSLFGLCIRNGILINVPVVNDAFSSQLKRDFNSYYQTKGMGDSTKVSLPHLPLNKDGYYTIRLVLLHHIDSTPYFETRGYIANQDSIKINPEGLKKKNTETAFGGNMMIQCERILVYGASFVFVIGLLSIILKRIDKKKKKDAEEKVIEEIRNDNGIAETIKQEVITKKDKSDWSFICKVGKYIKQDDNFLNRNTPEQSYLSEKEVKQSKRDTEQEDLEYSYVIQELLNRQWLKEEEDGSLSFKDDKTGTSIRRVYDIIYGYKSLRKFYKAFYLKPE